MDGTTIRRDRPFEPWRRPATVLGRDIVEKPIGLIKLKETRKRARRARDEASMRETVAAIISDAVCRDLEEPGSRISVPLSNKILGQKSRYSSPALSRQLPKLVQGLAPEYLTIIVGEWGCTGSGLRTTVGITPEFRHHLRQRNCSAADFAVEASGEPIELRAPKNGGARGSLLDYPDTNFTISERERMRIVNVGLVATDMRLEGYAGGYFDLSRRKLRRVFNNGSFEQGGRLFGGVWMDMPKDVRSAALRLNGERIATVDYRQMMPRLLYARAGADAPDDCYAVPGYEAHRPGWKRLLNALMYKAIGMKRCPRDLRPLLPLRMPIAECEQRLLAINGPIEPLLKPGVGHHLMFLESQLLIDVLIELHQRGIPALPIHDAVIVPVSRSDEAAQVMCSAFEDMTGYPGAVSIER